MKFCKDCKHYRTELSAIETRWDGRKQPVTAVPACDVLSRDMVTGQHITAYGCAAARGDKPGLCGPDARFFEPCAPVEGNAK